MLTYSWLRNRFYCGKLMSLVYLGLGLMIGAIGVEIEMWRTPVLGR
jgi:hypothetical protein